jgi:NAD(P)-dependent dehydrogenase (short-subunit alcohol dehydrogenase family)
MTNRLILLSGGSRGLGLALTTLYRERGWQALEFSRSANHPWSVRVDMTDPMSADAIVRGAIAPLATRAWDEILVVANAGVLAPIGPTALKDPAEVLRNIHTNYATPVMFMSAAVAAFQSHACRKTVLNISSGAAQRSLPGWSLYCGAKAGVEHFVRTLAIEQAATPHPLRAINVNPGLIDTAMQAAIRESSAEDFPAVGMFIQRKAAGELRPPEVVAAAIARMVDDARLEGGARATVDDYL